MSEYQEFLEERDKIDYLIQQGYRIKAAWEHLNGASVEFVHPQGNEQTILQIGTPNARKYFSGLLIKQNRANA